MGPPGPGAQTWWRRLGLQGPVRCAGFVARAEIHRDDFGLTWNQALETGGVMIGRTVTIDIDAEAVRQS